MPSAQVMEAVVKHLVVTGLYPPALKVFACVQKAEHYEATRVVCLQNSKRVNELRYRDLRRSWDALNDLFTHSSNGWRAQIAERNAQIAQAHHNFELAQGVAEVTAGRIERCLRILNATGARGTVVRELRFALQSLNWVGDVSLEEPVLLGVTTPDEWPEIGALVYLWMPDGYHGRLDRRHRGMPARVVIISTDRSLCGIRFLFPNLPWMVDDDAMLFPTDREFLRILRDDDAPTAPGRFGPGGYQED